ncbi:hypothetical protein CPAR01_05795 [Colletotrichum paranaense]|uniref:Uncharacterized protein n=1 Tax=Colletotrichum paranaense TaxID=1914294 RepID=A0ABQ9SSE5_9PEZI|nr:uncharacterized protein CPAR01_05795 [Colletotrichum paranaense]KAK1542408.1 hypothetical protein CPAR01_05795 [Colletotrichum paranaense]
MLRANWTLPRRIRTRPSRIRNTRVIRRILELAQPVAQTRIHAPAAHADLGLGIARDVQTLHAAGEEAQVRRGPGACYEAAAAEQREQHHLCRRRLHV